MVDLWGGGVQVVCTTPIFGLSMNLGNHEMLKITKVISKKINCK